VGTRFQPSPLGLPDYKLWLLYGKPAQGKVVVDAGAVKALRGKGSLLPVGIIGVEGDFGVGDAVMVVDESGTELAKGLVTYSKKDLDRVKGLQSARVAQLLPHTSPEAIHRNYMVLLHQ
jgi:glutamate 5-kinase